MYLPSGIREILARQDIEIIPDRAFSPLNSATFTAAKRKLRSITPVPRPERKISSSSSAAAYDRICRWSSSLDQPISLSKSLTKPPTSTTISVRLAERTQNNLNNKNIPWVPSKEFGIPFQPLRMPTRSMDCLPRLPRRAPLFDDRSRSTTTTASPRDTVSILSEALEMTDLATR